MYKAFNKKETDFKVSEWIERLEEHLGGRLTDAVLNIT